MLKQNLARNLAHSEEQDGQDSPGKRVDYNFDHSLIHALIERSRVHGNHSKRVRAIAIQLGLRLGLPRSQLVELSYGALLHDIGKLNVRLDVLNSPNKLDRQSEEWRHMESHSEMAVEILREHGMSEAILLCVRHHHENFDGTGYPSKLARFDIPELARIVALCDAWDTMTTLRAYAAPRTIDDAIAEIERCSGTQFDPYIVTVFLEMMKERRHSHDPIFGEAQG